jgi:predicted nucleic acid-binding protein
VTFLIDTSALVRVTRRQVVEEWAELVDRGLVAICDPVVTEALAIADAEKYDDIERSLARTYPRVPVPDDAWEIVASMRRELAKHGAHQALSAADYLVAATAVKRGLTILHEDRDFETTSRIIPMVQQQRVSEPPPEDPEAL